uniref:RNA-directed RNA polymerase n=1 Tax=Rhizoctonia solani megabirnavirus 2 TaxID=2820829 RepID=A0A8A5N371_9VIRU|nr:RNA-dependent RNA polymerase [Rhizoctonia solani megabirnavirus 2]
MLEIKRLQLEHYSKTSNRIVLEPVSTPFAGDWVFEVVSCDCEFCDPDIPDVTNEVNALSQIIFGTTDVKSVALFLIAVPYLFKMMPDYVINKGQFSRVAFNNTYALYSRYSTAICKLHLLDPTSDPFFNERDLFEASGFRKTPDSFTSPFHEPKMLRGLATVDQLRATHHALRLITERIFANQFPDVLLFYDAIFDHENTVMPDFTPVVNDAAGRKRAFGTMFWREDVIALRPDAERKHLLAKVETGRLDKYGPKTWFTTILKDPLSIANDKSNSDLASCMLLAMRSGDKRALHLLLQIAFPATEQAIADRQRVTPKVLAAVLCRKFVDKHSKSGDPHIAMLFRRALGFTFYAFTSMVLYYLSSRTNALIFMHLVELGVLDSGMEKYEKITKQIHNTARRGQMLPSKLVPILPVTRRNCKLVTRYMYLNVLVGRFYVPELTIDSTIPDRVAYLGEHVSVGPDEARPSEETFKHQFDIHLADLTDAAGATLRDSHIKTDSDWMLRFLSYGASGSATTKGKQQLGMEKSVSKSFWLAARSGNLFKEIFYESEPSNTTKTIIKREAGKIRQLLASDINAWFAESVVLNEIESTIMRGAPEIPLELNATEDAERVINRFRQVANLEDHCITDVDYADFNVTHTLADFARYFERLAELSMIHIPDGDFIDGVPKRKLYHDAALWAANALLRLHVKQGADLKADYELLNRGLWSGWRSTQFFNTTMNVLYARIARTSLRYTIGEEALISTENCGDDSHAIGKSLFHGLSFASTLCEQGHELNSAKQLIGAKASEFLRVTYYPDFIAIGAMCRSIAGFVGSDLQRPANRAGRDFTQGCWNAGNNLIRRGFNRDNMLIILEELTAYWGIAIASDGRKLSFPRSLIHASTRNGGWGCQLFGSYDTLLDCTFPSHPLFKPAEHWAAPEMPAVDNFQNRFAQYVNGFGLRLVKPDILRHSLINAVITNQNYDFLDASIYDGWNDLVYSHCEEVIEFCRKTKKSHIPHVPLSADDKILIDSVLDTFFQDESTHTETKRQEGLHHGLVAHAPVTPEPNIRSESALEEYIAAIRASALGLFSAADMSAYNSTKPVDVGRHVPVAALLLMLKPDAVKKQLMAVYSRIPSALFIPLIDYQVHIPAIINGLIPSELRGKLNFIHNTVLARLKIKLDGLEPKSIKFPPPLVRQGHDLRLGSGYDAYTHDKIEQIMRYLMAVNAYYVVEYQRRGMHHRLMW